MCVNIFVYIYTNIYIYKIEYISIYNQKCIYFRRNKVYASCRLQETSISVNRGSHFQVRFFWQVWDGELSPSIRSTRLKAFGGWKFNQGRSQDSKWKGRAQEEIKHFHCRKLNKRNFCPTSASRHRCSIVNQEDWRFPKSSIDKRHVSQRRQACCVEQ